MITMRRILGSWYDVPLVKFVFELVFVILPIAFFIRTFVFGLYQVPTGSMEPTLLVGERFLADKLTYWFRAPKRGEIIAFNAPDKSVCPQGYAYSKNPIVNLFERYVYGPDNWTKRVIGIPGDHVEGKTENGRTVIYLNGKKLDEPYVNPFPIIRIWKDKPSRYLTGNNSVIKTYDPAKSFEEQSFYKFKETQIVKDPNSGEPFELLQPGTPTKGDVFDKHLGPNEYWVMGDNRLGSGDCRAWDKLDGRQIHGKIVFRFWSMDTQESWWIVDLIKNPLTFFKKVRWHRCFQFVH